MHISIFISSYLRSWNVADVACGFVGLRKLEYGGRDVDVSVNNEKAGLRIRVTSP